MGSTPLSSSRQHSTRSRFMQNGDTLVSLLDSPSALEPPQKRRRITQNGELENGRSSATSRRQSLSDDKGTATPSRFTSSSRTVRRSAAHRAAPSSSSKPRRESRRARLSTRPRFSSAAAAAAAVVHGDGYKPREERGWEEFHQDLDIDAKLPVFSADEVDGKVPSSMNASPYSHSPSRESNSHLPEAYANGSCSPSLSSHNEPKSKASPDTTSITPRRRPGRPFKRMGSMLKGIGLSPDAPKIIPSPGFNPREKLTLPKPSFRSADPFSRFEEKEEFVDQAMSHVGYQETEVWARPRFLIKVTEGNIEDDLAAKFGSAYSSIKDDGTGIGPIGVGRVEYDMDEQDAHWLAAVNQIRHDEDFPEIKPWIFEVTMTKIEKEWHALEKRIPKPNPKPPQTHRPRSGSAAAVNGELAAASEEQDSRCAICDDGDCENTNAIVFCDGCDLAVHQECYGVPFIPEGQWLCRKCQLIGRGTPTCIFCPNTDGAFKQTNASRWSHLLCAIWIPEVSIGNTTFMEPVMDVEKVPKPRWKLTCYICRQKMGACIQCGNKNCYIAFHVTCARRARLFLKMKSTHGGPTNLDASALKAFCDKHVPNDWRQEHDVDHAIIDAMEYYRYSMRGRLWADSQQTALTSVPSDTGMLTDDQPTGQEMAAPKITLKLGVKNANRPGLSKIVWKLPSGAPVIPITLYNSIEYSLSRFTIQKRRGFAADLCKYWTLKREARRGAALLKRLQLQMETFTSMEIPRRNFVGMGAAGALRLQRRIDFADILLEDIERLRDLCEQVLDKEREKLTDARLLGQIMDTVYFPVAILLPPIFYKVYALDSKAIFAEGLAHMSRKLELRSYTKVMEFATDLANTINTRLKSLQSMAIGSEHMARTDGESHSKVKHTVDKAYRSLAKRIVKAAQTLLEDAVKKEHHLLQSQPEDDLHDLDSMLQACLNYNEPETPKKLGHGSLEINGDDLSIREEPHDMDAMSIDPLSADSPVKQKLFDTEGAKTNSSDVSKQQAVIEPSSKASSAPVINGNYSPARSRHDSIASESITPQRIPWYMENFAPDGTTMYEEQFDNAGGSDSEDLSDLDDEAMLGLMQSTGDKDGAPITLKGIADAVVVQPAKPARAKPRRRSLFSSSKQAKRAKARR